jgi:hypothetical protein
MVYLFFCSTIPVDCVISQEIGSQLTSKLVRLRWQEHVEYYVIGYCSRERGCSEDGIAAVDLLLLEQQD